MIERMILNSIRRQTLSKIFETPITFALKVFDINKFCTYLYKIETFIKSPTSYKNEWTVEPISILGKDNITSVQFFFSDEKIVFIRANNNTIEINFYK